MPSFVVSYLKISSKNDEERGAVDTKRARALKYFAHEVDGFLDHNSQN